MVVSLQVSLCNFVTYLCEPFKLSEYKDVVRHSYVGIKRTQFRIVGTVATCSYSEMSACGIRLGRGLEELASASWFWPRPRPRPQSSDLGLGISVLASFNITAQTLGAGPQGSKTLVTPLCMLIPFDPEES